MSDIGNKEIFAKNLSYYIERSGKSKKEIAEIVGVAASTLNEWTKGKKYPRIDKIEILAKYFRILKSDLIENKSDEHRKMQKNNDDIVAIVVRLRKDEKFLSVVKAVNNLDDEKLSGVEQMLLAFRQ